MSSGSCYDPTDPAAARQYTQCGTEGDQDVTDDLYGEYLAKYGAEFDIYIVVDYKETPVFGEDPTKVYTDYPFIGYGYFEPTPENQSFGRYPINSETEVLKVQFHRTTVRSSIRNTLVAEGLADDSILLEGPNDFDQGPGGDPGGLTKKERQRRDLQEGDMILSRFNNIHYEITDIALEPDHQQHLAKYVYTVTAHPRLVSGEDLGAMQDVTDEEEIREKNNNDIDTEANKIIF